MHNHGPKSSAHKLATCALGAVLVAPIPFPPVLAVWAPTSPKLTGISSHHWAQQSPLSQQARCCAMMCSSTTLRAPAPRAQRHTGSSMCPSAAHPHAHAVQPSRRWQFCVPWPVLLLLQSSCTGMAASTDTGQTPLTPLHGARLATISKDANTAQPRLDVNFAEGNDAATMSHVGVATMSALRGKAATSTAASTATTATLHPQNVAIRPGVSGNPPTASLHAGPVRPPHWEQEAQRPRWREPEANSSRQPNVAQRAARSVCVVTTAADSGELPLCLSRRVHSASRVCGKRGSEVGRGARCRAVITIKRLQRARSKLLKTRSQ